MRHREGERGERKIREKKVETSLSWAGVCAVRPGCVASCRVLPGGPHYGLRYGYAFNGNS
jgi:hypothetical protein